jgi:hypothetical protein
MRTQQLHSPRQVVFPLEMIFAGSTLVGPVVIVVTLTNHTVE